MSPDPTPLRIVQLTANNVMGLRAIDITPDPHVVLIGGRNAQGKTSVLNAIWLALGGGTASRAIADQVREGADGADVTVDLGEIVVSRVWKADGTSTLEVRGAMGGKFSSPQGVLDSFLGKLSFDPTAFLRLRAKEQVTALLDVVDLPFDPDEMARLRLAYYDERTAVGRTVTKLQGQLAGLPTYDDTPDDEVDLTALAADLEAKTRIIGENEAARTRAETLDNEVSRIQSRKMELEAELARVEQQLTDATDAQEAAVEYAESLVDPDVDELRARIDAAALINDQVRSKQQRLAVARQLADAEREVQNLTGEINGIDLAKAEGLAATKMPVDGLGIDLTGDPATVTYNDVPLDQCSGAERLRVAVKMAMVLNPQIRVIRVTDGSLLDDDNLALIAEMAETDDYQVWIERVGTGDASAIIIEDGQVAGADL